MFDAVFAQLKQHASRGVQALGVASVQSTAVLHPVSSRHASEAAAHVPPSPAAQSAHAPQLPISSHARAPELDEVVELDDAAGALDELLELELDDAAPPEPDDAST